MKRSLRIGSFILVIAVLFSCAAFAETGSMKNFVKSKTYEDGWFEDVPSDKWYAADVKNTYEFSLFNGVRENLFGPDGDITIAETVTLAVRLSSLYKTGKQFADTQTQPWYACYSEYAFENGIISEELSSDDACKLATRAQFVSILANAIPLDEYKMINSVASGIIPDIPEDASYKDAAYTFYRAGILTGADEKGSLLPNANIKRCAVAAIISRIVDPSQRKKVEIKQDNTAVEMTDGIAVTKLPYSTNGLTVENISFSADKKSAICRLVNDTAYAVAKYSNIRYVCYDANGRTIRTGIVSFDDLNVGESVDSEITVQEGTAKILFGEGSVYKGLQANESSVTLYDKVYVTTLPYTSKGITVKSIKIDNSDAAKPVATLIVENNSGETVSGRTSFEYKFYNGSEKELASASFYIMDLNNGESCKFDLKLKEGTKRFILGDATVVDCDHFDLTEMQTSGKLSVTKAPYESKGLVIESVSVSGLSMKCKVTNKAGFTVQEISNFAYKCYDADDNVIAVDKMYLTDMYDGQSYNARVNLPAGTKKVVFGVGTVYKK